MRYLPVVSIKEGMILAKSLYGETGEFLIPKDIILTKTHVEKIRQWGYQGIYVIDEISRDIKLQEAVSEDLKMQMTVGINKFFIQVSSEEDSDSEDLKVIRKLVEDMIEEILSNKNLVINMIDLKNFDSYTCQHSVNVAILALMVGVMLKLSKKDLYQLGMAAFLHDIGKCFIDKEILNKPGKLTDEEFMKIKEHSKEGQKFLNHFKLSGELDEVVVTAILQHHERCDGKGYPFGLKQDEIHLFARIITLCDVYDALVAERPYRKAMLPSDAMEYIMANAGSQFDLKLCELFVQKVASYPIGMIVKLSSGEVGIVTKNVEGFTLRPVIKILTDENENKIQEVFIIDLKEQIYYNKTVVKVLQDFEIN